MYMTLGQGQDLGPRSRNDLDLQYSLTFINLKRCLLLPTFRSLAAMVSEKSTIFTFSYGKAQVTKFEQTMMGWSPRCYISCFVEIGPPVPEKIFEGFLPYKGVAEILFM